jgi:hypothetical protein
VADRSPHLPGDFGGNVRALRDERIDRSSKERNALSQRLLSPGTLRGHGRIETAINRRLVGERTFNVNAPIDRAYGFLHFSHGFLPARVCQMISK